MPWPAGTNNRTVRVTQPAWDDEHVLRPGRHLSHTSYAIRKRVVEEGPATAFVVEDLRVRDSRVIVDGMVQIPVSAGACRSCPCSLVADATRGAVLHRSAPVGAQATAIGDPAVLLDADADQLARLSDPVPFPVTWPLFTSVRCSVFRGKRLGDDVGLELRSVSGCPTRYLSTHRFTDAGEL